MISTDPSEGSGIPVVHIRIVCDGGCSRHSCDFCQKSFHSAADLDEHVNFSHSSLDIQDVYVCPSCKCCLLSHSDLQDHLSARHQMPMDVREESTLCEFCGLNLTSKECLVNHTMLRHYSRMPGALLGDLGIVELGLKDISSMGMGDPDCKTLFQVIEVSLAKDVAKVSPSKTGIDKESSTNDEAVENVSEGITTQTHEDISHQQSEHCHGISPFKSELSGDENFVNNHDSMKEIVSEDDVQDDCDSHLEIIICSDVDEKSVVSSSPGEIILTVESEEELVWNKDVMSQVICSSGILERTQRNLNMQKGDPGVQYGTLQQSNNIFDGDYSLKVSSANKGKVQKCSIKSHDLGMANEEDTLIICDQEINVAKTDVIKTTGTHGDTHPNLCSPVTVKSDLGKTLKTTNDHRRLLKGKVCRICGVVFRQLGDLQQHEHNFHGIRIKCDLCDDTFVFSKSLRNHHLRKHSSVASFQCKDCNKFFKCRSNLWSHRLTHLSQEMHRFQCPQCPQRFATKSKLNVHLQSHTGEKRFQCEECGKGFVYQGLLLRHMKKHIPEKDSRFLKERCKSSYVVEMGGRCAS